MEKTNRVGIILKYTHPNTFEKFKKLENLINFIHHNNKLKLAFAYCEKEDVIKIKNILKKFKHKFELKYSELFNDQNLNFSLNHKENENQDLILMKDEIDLKNIEELVNLPSQIKKYKEEDTNKPLDI